MFVDPIWWVWHVVGLRKSKPNRISDQEYMSILEIIIITTTFALLLNIQSDSVYLSEITSCTPKMVKSIKPFSIGSVVRSILSEQVVGWGLGRAQFQQGFGAAGWCTPGPGFGVWVWVVSQPRFGWWASCVCVLFNPVYLFKHEWSTQKFSLICPVNLNTYTESQPSLN